MAGVGFLKIFRDQCRAASKLFKEEDLKDNWKGVLEKGPGSSSSTTQKQTTSEVPIPTITLRRSSTWDKQTSTPASTFTSQIESSTPTTTSQTPTPASQQSEDTPPPESHSTEPAPQRATPADSPPTQTLDQTSIPDHTNAPTPSSSLSPNHTPVPTTPTKTIVAAAAGSTAFLALLAVVLYILRRRYRKRSQTAGAEERWDPNRGIHEYKSPTLPDVGMCGGAGGVYEKSGDGDGGGNGLERYTRGDKVMRIRGGGEMGREVRVRDAEGSNQPISPGVSELHSPAVSELHSPTIETRVAELHSPTIEKHVAELGGSTRRIERGSVVGIGGSETGRGVELPATPEVQPRFYAGGR
jgi:hypothetical protein